MTKAHSVGNLKKKLSDETQRIFNEKSGSEINKSGSVYGGGRGVKAGVPFKFLLLLLANPIFSRYQKLNMEEKAIN